jgi:Carboxypeptidase regulatory-like domain
VWHFRRKFPLAFPFFGPEMREKLISFEVQERRAPSGAWGRRHTRLRPIAPVFRLLVGCLAAATCGAAQTAGPAPNPDDAGSTVASIHGTVESAEGAVYQGAQVELDLSAGPPAIQQTDSEGAFSFTNLPAGEFHLTVSSTGFETQQVAGVLQPGQIFETRTITLPVARASSEVLVSGGSQVEIAQAQLDLEEKQRVLGILPNYYVSYDHDALPLTTRQKYQLAWRTEIDPMTWFMTGFTAGVEQADNTFAGYGQGSLGYARRFGANYADGFVGTMLGGAILPSWFKQDPRYFYKGTGSIPSRAAYAIANAVICKGDNGHWQANYSAIVGGLAAGGISNIYYPASDRSGFRVSMDNALIGTAEGALQNLIQEFIVRRLTPRLPHYPSLGTQ